MESLFSNVDIYILRLCRNSITCIGMFREVLLLLSQSTLTATEKRTPNLEMCSENFEKFLGKAL